VTGIQPAEDLLPIVKHNPARFAFLANVNPHLHYPVAGEVARQVGMGAVGLKVHPVHAGVSAADPMLYPAYQLCAAEGLPVVVHCGTSAFPGADNSLAAPDLLHENVWIELSGLPPQRLPDYYGRFGLRRLARKFIFATDWPGVPGIARNARAVAALDLGDEVLAGVLAGNALRVYSRLVPPEQHATEA
jgi:predicted TIM-barrel fold metal-dependent hydrolase